MFRLLIVDDEPMIREGMAAYAARLWPQETEWVLCAENGEQAWQFIETGHIPDILITDIRMPRGDGMELLGKIRKRELGIKAIVLSGYSDFEYVRGMALLGIENYLLKPVNEEELISTMENTLQKMEKEKELKLQARLNEGLIRENIINRWIYGAIGEDEFLDRADFLNLDLEAESYRPCCIRFWGTEDERNAALLDEIYQICRNILEECPKCYCSRNYSGDVIAVFCAGKQEQEKMDGLLNQCLFAIRRQTGQKAYALLGDYVRYYWKVSESFRNAIANGVYIDRIEPREKQEATEETDVSPLSLRAAQYVLEHYREDISLKSLASGFHGNAAYIGQVFKRDMNQSFSDYLKNVRLEKAKEYLTETDLSAREIAQRVGFANTTYFCTVFKKETGLSPDRYRKEFRHEPEGAI